MMTKKIVIKLKKYVGTFAENKDLARTIRKEQINPALKDGNELILDFGGIESATQSFIHALISEVIRAFGSDIIDRIAFKNCNPTVQNIIEIVIDYMQQSE